MEEGLMGGSELYRCHCRVGFKFFQSSYMVIIPEEQISSVTMNLVWNPAFVPMNSAANADLMSYATQDNTCNVTIVDPFFTSLAWPSLFDVAGQMIGDYSYLSSGVLLPPCGKGQVPGKDGCWNYEKLDLEMLYGQNNPDLANLLKNDVNMFVPPMLFISLWYETPSGYTYGTDYLFRVNGSSISHGKEYPSVTIGGAGNYGVVFQERLVTQSIDNTNVEKSLEELAARNGFKLQFCQANYDEPRTLKRKVIKSNVTVREVIDDVIRSQLDGDYTSPPTKEFFNTLHVCTRADTYQGCSVFYLGKPLYESFKVDTRVDPSFVGRNISFGDKSMTAIPGQRNDSPESSYLPGSNFLADSSWEVIPPPPEAKNYPNIKEIKISASSVELTYRDEKKYIGEWKEFKAPREKYFTNLAQKLILLTLDGTNKVKKEELEKINPGWVGKWEKDTLLGIYAGRVVEITANAEKKAKNLSLKTTRVIGFKTPKGDLKFPSVYMTLGNGNINPDIVTSRETRLGEWLGVAGKDQLQTITFYIVISGSEKIYLDPELVLKYSFDAQAIPPQAIPGVTSIVPAQRPGVRIEGRLDSKEKLVADFFIAQGFTKAGIAALLGTIKAESTFNPRASNGIYYGLIQWGGDRRAKMPKDPGSTEAFMKAQLQYVMTELSGANGKTSSGTSIESVLKTSDDIEVTMGTFTDHYVRPSAEKRNRNSKRFVYAREYFNKINVLSATGGKGGDEETTDAPISIQPTANTSATNFGSCIFDGFAWPTTGVVTSPYGTRYGGQTGHGGIDIGAALGTPIFAAGCGRVTNVKNDCSSEPDYKCYAPGMQGFGNAVTIQHSDKYWTVYGHMKKGSVTVKKGEIVKKGQKIGEMANSGASGGIHLHFEIHENAHFSKINPYSAGRPPKNTPIVAGTTKNLKQPSSSGNTITSTQGGGTTTQPGGQPAVNGQNQPGRMGFTIDTEFKGVPRALRILPKFTVLSLLTKYSEWYEKGFPDDDSMDPGIWMPVYFRNWLISSVALNWSNGDLRVNLSAMSSFGIDNSSLVPTWDQYQQYLARQGGANSYKDYIRGFGDLCWENIDGSISCHTQCALVQDFTTLYGPQVQNPLTGSAASITTTGCRLDNGKINFSAQDTEVLRRIAIAEAIGEKKIGMALVVRAILNRKLIIENGAKTDYMTNGSSSIKDIVFADNGGQFEPIRNKAYNSVDPKDFPLADEAIALAFDIDALKAAKISDYILTASNFRNAPPESGWVDRGQSYKNHLYGRDKVQDRIFKIPEHLLAFETRYGKCEKVTTGGAVTAKAKSALECLTFKDVESLALFIESAESANSNYNAVNTPGGGPSTFNAIAGKSYENITVKEVLDLQKQNKIYATGRYQLIPNTLSKAVSGAGINPAIAYNKATQDRLFIWLITVKRPEIGDYLISNTSDIVEAAQGLAREWAGISISKPEAPYKQLVESGSATTGPKVQVDVKKNRKVGQSLYHGYNRNASVKNNHIKAQSTLKAIRDKVGNRCKGTTTTSISSGVYKYKNISKKRNVSLPWGSQVTRPGVVKKLAVTVGHFNTRITESGAGKREGVPSDTTEKDMNTWIYDALLAQARQRGIEIVSLSPQQSSSMSLESVTNWLSKKRNEGYFSFEIHNDANDPNMGRAGVIVGGSTPLWEMDKRLADEFGYFERPYKRGKPPSELRAARLGSAILECYDMGNINIKLKTVEERKKAAVEAATRILDALYGK